MAPTIQILTESLVNKIAAGEVIERPASVVKELVENAIDAKADRIQITIKAGGRQLISIGDNGCGMSREDALLCVERHATSKMRSPTDLFAIETMGFRGEALSSIAAIARLRLDTRQAQDDEATRIVVEGGVQRLLETTARAPGTTVEVGQLFFNTPARRKFMRKVETEARFIVQTVTQLAAAHPSIAFELQHQERTLFQVSSGSKRQRAAQILKVPGEILRQVDLEEEGVKVEGWVSPPPACIRARNRQYLVVRQRPIAARKLTDAVYEGYGGLLAEDRHPAFVLWLDLDPRQVDVNVHPTKREIRLAEEEKVCAHLQKAVRQALDLPEERGFVYAPQDQDFKPVVLGEARPAFLSAEAPKWSPIEPETPDQLNFALAPAPPGGAPPAADSAQESPTAETPVNPSGLKTDVWQLHGKFLVAQTPDGLLLIDQNIAHQRVLFEAALAQLEAEGATRQQLLIPLTVELDPLQVEVVRQAEDLLARLGFGLRAFGGETYLVDAIPAGLKNWHEGELLFKVIDGIVAEQKLVPQLNHALAASYARQAAVKSGTVLPAEERHHLLAALLAADEPYVGPGGKPTMIKLALSDLERLFSRK